MLELRRILVPYDFSDASLQAARYACDLASHFNAEVTLLHVLPPLRYDFAMSEPTADRAKELNEHRMSNARIALDSLSAGLVAKEPIQCNVIEGDPAHEIITAANERAYDAVVMSTLGRERFAAGSSSAQ
jgi:nucleotide-binding universal stress UspA family protein